MYLVPIRFSTKSEADRRGGFRSDNRFGKRKGNVRPRARRSRRYLAYAGLLVGFCVLLAFAGCGTIAGSGQLIVAGGGVNFGAVTVGKIGTATVSFKNLGAGAVSVSSVNITGGPFAVAGSIRYPVSVAAGSTYSLQVQFTPSAAGQVAGAVTLMTSAAAAPPTVNLTGLGVNATTAPSGLLSGISCNSSSLVGSGTDNCLVELSGQAGSGGVTVNLASTSTAVTVPASVTVPENATEIGFTATVAAVSAAQSATLSATVGGISESFALQLNAALRVLSANASQVLFGLVAVNSTATQSVMLTSSGTQAVTVESTSLTGSGFSIGGLAFPVTVNPGQSILLQLEFVPTIAGAVSGQITISSNATAGGTMAIPVSGTGGVPYAVNLTWAAPTSSADAVVGYKVYRSIGGASSYQLLNSAVNTGTTFTDTTVANGQSYVYYVTSVDVAGGESVPSNTFDVAIP
jgi:hypothetical protein